MATLDFPTAEYSFDRFCRGKFPFLRSTFKQNRKPVQVRRQYFRAILLSLPIAHVSAQPLPERYTDHYTTANGLSHNAITGITQDAAGYVWIATNAGLNRFNGSSFAQFHSNDHPGSLPSEEIWGMNWLDSYRLAVFTAGLHIIDTRTGKTHNLFVPSRDPLYQYKFNMIERASGDDKGNIYLLTRSGFYHFDSSYALVSRFDYYSAAELPVTHFFFGRDLFELDADRLMIVSINGLYLYDKREKKLRKMKPSDCPAIADLPYPAVFYNFFQNKRGNLFVMKPGSDSLIYLNTLKNTRTVSRLPFIPTLNDFHYRSRLIPESDTSFFITGHTSGFYRIHFNPASGVTRFYPAKQFASYLCSGLLADRNKNLWVATTRGLFYLDRQKPLVETNYLAPGIEDAFPGIKLDDISVSKDKIYAAGRSGSGLFVFDKKTLAPARQILFEKNDKRNFMRAIAMVDSNTLLLGTNGPLLLFDERTQKNNRLIPPGWDLNNDWASDVYRDRRGNIWISSTSIYRYEPAIKKFTVIPALQKLLSIPFGIAEDTSGNIWMSGHGLARYNTRTNRYDIILDSFPFIKMMDKQVNILEVDGNNTVWFNGNNNGLTAYNIATGQFRHFTKKQGLPDDNIASIAVIGDQLWIACYSGIACMDLNSSKLVSFGKEDGFPDMPVQKGARFFYDTTEKKLYISFATAIARFDPDQMLRSKSAPTVFFETVGTGSGNTHYLPGRSITTSWNDNDISITIGSIDYSHSGGNPHFAYRIVKDSSSPWVTIGTQSSFNISGLSPGIHTIQVKSWSPYNRWAEQVKSISIEVRPPFWLKKWFVLGMSLLAFVSLYLFIRWRTGLARKKEMEKTHIEKLKADDYKNQFELEQVSGYFSSSLSGKKTEDAVLWDVAQNLMGRMNYEDCMIYLWNSDKTKMIQKAAFGPKGDPDFISAHRFDVLPGQGVVGYVMETRQPVLIQDTRTDSRYRVDERFRLSEVCVPIIHNGELLGIIDSEHPDPGYYSERDIKILTTIATLIGNKLTQLKSEQSLDAKHRELAGINEQLAEARLSALQAQMNPHFVFNALNSIKRLILENDNENASRYLSKFASMIRMTLHHSKEIFTTLEENIDYLKAYLEMEQLRFDDSFTYRIWYDTGIDITETLIPSMMMQPLAENAIWHGLLPSNREKKIHISFAENNGAVICMVEDNGIGVHRSTVLNAHKKPMHQSLGLENLQKRIRILNEKYGLGCRLDIKDLSDDDPGTNGTRAILYFNTPNLQI